MKQLITWTKGFFDSNYQLFNNGKIIGTLIFDNWRNDAVAQDLNSTISFKTNGYINPNTTIFNDKQESIGTITYNAWQMKATVHLNTGETYAWYFSNSRLSKWIISDFKEKYIHFQAQNSKGDIESSNTDTIMLVTGLFIKEYYARIAVVILITIFAIFFGRFAI